MPYFNGHRDRVYYRAWNAEKPCGQVLLLHGFGEHTGHYHRLAHCLTAQQYDVFGPDHLGHGHTGGAKPGHYPSVDELAENAALLVERMEAERPGLPVAIVGHSLGALTGALLAISNPDRWAGLVMTGAPLWGLPKEAAGQTDLIMSEDEAYLDALDNDPLAFDTAAAEDNLWATISVAGCKVRASLPALSMPTLLINGENDVFAPADRARRFASELLRGRAVTIPGGYHDIPNDRSHHEVARVVIAALNEWCTTSSAPSR
ncbi:alpha/beta fold hydrolase [Gordonia polyisoprenivorans]|uniref:alpha/beta fold hydrolase n=1 Tax=Gordonia polyisoprenivorans TaxID=84595 RepID=UPI0003719B33|nr:alpha/beta fold hydrolase [Gordonia polyisoprenivorans]